MGQNQPLSQRLLTDDGELIEGVKSVEWQADANDPPRVVVTFFAERVDFDLEDQPEEVADVPD
jgi:hypothetical protein